MLGLSRSGFCFRKSRTSARSWGRSKKTAPTTWTRTTTTPTAANLERNFDSTVVGRRRRLSVVTVDAAVVAVVVVALVVVVAQIPDFRRFRNCLDLQLPVFHDRSQAPAVVAGVEPMLNYQFEWTAARNSDVIGGRPRFAPSSPGSILSITKNFSHDVAEI